MHTKTIEALEKRLESVKAKQELIAEQYIALRDKYSGLNWLKQLKANQEDHNLYRVLHYESYCNRGEIENLDTAIREVKALEG